MKFAKRAADEVAQWPAWKRGEPATPEPSKEALEMARRIQDDVFCASEDSVEHEQQLMAAALQKLMDERDTYYAQFKVAADRSAANFSRADAAEARAEQLAKNCMQMAESRAVQEKRAEAAEAKLAKCVRELRDLMLTTGRSQRRRCSTSSTRSRAARGQTMTRPDERITDAEHDRSGVRTWHVVVHDNRVLGVFGERLLDEAQACARKVELDTGLLPQVLQIRGVKPRVGSRVK